MIDLDLISDKAEDVDNIFAAIHGIARLVNEDLARRGSADSQPFLNETSLGDLMLAVEHLSTYGEGLAERVGDRAKEGKS